MRPIATDGVAWSAGRSVCLSLSVSHAKAAEPIVMLLGILTRVRPGNHVLDGGPDPYAKGQFRQRKGQPIVK